MREMYAEPGALVYLRLRGIWENLAAAVLQAGIKGDLSLSDP